MKSITKTFLLFTTVLGISNAFSQNNLENQLYQKLGELPYPPPTQIYPKGKGVRPALFTQMDSVREVYNPVREQFAGTKDGAIYLRKPNQAAIQVIQQLPMNGWSWDIEGAMWSPDGQLLAVKQINEEGVPLIELELDSITKYKKGYTRAGQALPKHQYHLVNIASGTVDLVKHGQEHPYIHSIGWSADSKKMRFLRSGRLMKKIDILEYDVSKKTIREIFSEESNTYLVGLQLLQGKDEDLKRKKQVVFLDSTFIWQSESSGYNQLYLYDLEGKLIQPLTSLEKNGIVYELCFVDKGFVYFIASASLDQVYERHLFRASLNQPNIEKIVVGPQLYLSGTSKHKDTLWIDRIETYRFSVELYTPSGALIDKIGSADLSFLQEEGYQPEYLWVNAPGNDARMPTLLIKPKNFDPSKKYPVIEYLYAGSHTIFIPRFFLMNPELQFIANQGYVVVVSDTRGTPGQGKKYQDYIYGRMGQIEITDHAYVLEQLANERPFMDLDKVGVTGGSWGGYFTIKALLERPDLYKAGFITAASTDLSTMRVPVEIYMGCLPSECPDKYAQGDNTNKLQNFKAPLFIMHGTNDDDVPKEESEKLYKLLKSQGNENVELLQITGWNHFVGRNEEYLPKLIEFFEKYLK